MDKGNTYLNTGEEIECRLVREEVVISPTYTEDVVLNWAELLDNMLEDRQKVTE